MTDLDLAALRAKVRSDNERVFCIVLPSDKLNALIDRVEKAEAAEKRSTDILRIAENDADVARAYRGEAEEEISRLRTLLARAGEALRDAIENGNIAADLADNIREKGNYSEETTIMFLGAIPCGASVHAIAREIEEIGHE